MMPSTLGDIDVAYVHRSAFRRQEAYLTDAAPGLDQFLTGQATMPPPWCLRRDADPSTGLSESCLIMRLGHPADVWLRSHQVNTP